MKVKLSEIIIPKLYPLFHENEGVSDIFLTSGRAGTKSSAAGIDGDYTALSKETAIVYMRKNKNKLKTTVFAESKRAFSRLGLSLSRSTHSTISPMKITIKQNGSAIYFSGSDNPDDTKGMIDDKYSISKVYIDELTEFFKMGYDRGKEELEQIRSTFVRGNDESFKMIYMFNPPQNANHPVMKFLEEKKYIHDKEGNRIGLNPRTLHIHVTYLDVPPEWLGKALIESAEETKRIDEEYYRWLWLGESVGVKNVIYHMFDEKKHVKAYEGQSLYNIGIGVDYGNMNATTFNAFGIDRETMKLQGIGSYKHSGRNGNIKSPSDYASDLVDFVKDIEVKTGGVVKFITIDPSALGFAEEAKRQLRANGLNATIRAAQNNVKEGIARTQVLLRNEAILLDHSMTGAIEEFGLYTYDPKSIDKGEEKPIKDNDHDMDGIRYLVMEQYDYLKPYLKTEIDT